MNMLVLLLFVQAIFSITYPQNDYRFVVKGINAVAVNSENVECDAFMSRIDRYTTAQNVFLRFKLDITSHSHYKILLKCYEFLNNEYRPFAIHLERSICSFLENEYKTIIYPDFVRHNANMLKPKCPILKGNYSLYNYIPNSGTLPVGLPFKNLLVEFKVLNGTKVELHLRAYAMLDRDAAIRERYT